MSNYQFLITDTQSKEIVSISEDGQVSIKSEASKEELEYALVQSMKMVLDYQKKAWVRVHI